MSEKLCLQWNDFKDNAIASFRSLRDNDEFADVTLVCEDGKHIQAHNLGKLKSSLSQYFNEQNTRAPIADIHAKSEIRRAFSHP